jgi:hypothetical protein
MPNNVEWLNENAGRAFPFREDSLLTDESSAITLPNFLFVDFIFVVPADVSAFFYLKTLAFVSGQITAVIANDSDIDVASITVDLDTHSPNDVYDVVGIGEFADARGRAAFGDLSDLGSFVPEGTYSFDSANVTLEDRVVRPDLRSVRSLQVFDLQGGLSDPISGVVRLVPGANIKLTVVPETVSLIPDPVTGTPVPVVTAPAGVRIDAIADPDFNEECDCETTFPQPPCIRMINGVPPDDTGEIILEPEDDCIQISPGGGNIVTIDDNCCQPCCGCKELEFITNNLLLAKETIRKLEDILDQTRTRQENFYNNVLGSLL